MKIISRIVSFLFHPLLFPTYATLLIIAVNPNRFGYFGERLHFVWLIIVFALTFVFPSIWMLMMKKLEMIESVHLETARDRIIPFIASSTFYLWAAWMFKPNVEMKIPPNELVFFMMLGACLSIFSALFINIFSKISLHAIGAGNFIGLTIVLLRMSTYDLRFVLVAVVVLAGIIGAARLILNAHTQREVFMGYAVGFTAQFAAFTLLPKLF